MLCCRPKKMTCRRPKKMTCRRPFQATATELRAESVGNVPAMDFEAADELQTTPLRDFARARMQEIYHKIRDAETNQTHGDAPEHSRIHSCATRHLVHRFIGMFSTLSKMILNDENEEDCADLHYKCKCIIQELRTKRDGSTVPNWGRALLALFRPSARLLQSIAQMVLYYAKIAMKLIIMSSALQRDMLILCTPLGLAACFHLVEAYLHRDLYT